MSSLLDEVNSGGYEKKSTENMELRNMTVDDLPQVLAIERVSFPTPWTENIFRDEIHSFLCSNLVATLKGKVVGYIDFSIILDEIHLRNIAVHKDFKKKGIASQLLSRMIKIGSEKGALWSTLEVRRSNTNAIKLYEKFGFVITGVRPLYYRDTKEDAIIMWADLRKCS